MTCSGSPCHCEAKEFNADQPASADVHLCTAGPVLRTQFTSLFKVIQCCLGGTPKLDPLCRYLIYHLYVVLVCIHKLLCQVVPVLSPITYRSPHRGSLLKLPKLCRSLVCFQSCANFKSRIQFCQDPFPQGHSEFQGWTGLALIQGYFEDLGLVGSGVAPELFRRCCYLENV